MRDGLTEAPDLISEQQMHITQFLCVCGWWSHELGDPIQRVGCGRAVVYQEARHRAAKQGFRVLYREPQYKSDHEVCPSRCGHINTHVPAVDKNKK